MEAGLIDRDIKDVAVLFDPIAEVLLVDMSKPRLISVRARHPLTRVEKNYILKVTEKGVCLV